MNYSKLVLFVFSILCIIAVSDKTVPINPPIIQYALIYISLLILIVLGIIDKKFQNISPYFKRTIIIYWIYSIFIIIYGFTSAESYWDYKNIFITYFPAVMISFVVFIGLRFEENLNLLRFILKRIFPITIILGVIAFTFYSETKYNYSSSRLAIPIFLFILAFPFLKRNHQLLIIFISIFCIFIDLDWRTNIGRIIACWGCVLVYFLFLLKRKLLNLIGIMIFVTPLWFLYIGSTGKFDIFDSLSKNDSSLLGGNSRTFLYEEVFESLRNKNVNILIGGSAVAGYQTFYFQDDQISLYTKRNRYKSEVNFLNTLNKSGMIGVILDILLLFIPAYFAINRSNNSFSKLLGLYLFLSWPLYFLEMPLAFNLNYFLYYFVIGLCLNESFRSSTDKQIKLFFGSL